MTMKIKMDRIIKYFMITKNYILDLYDNVLVRTFLAGILTGTILQSNPLFIIAGVIIVMIWLNEYKYDLEPRNKLF